MSVHPTAILEGDITLADDVSIGPHCVLTGPVTIGAGTTLIGNCYLHGPLSMGEANVVYPFTCIGFAPQHARFDPATPGPGTVIGDHNTFREGVTIHRAFTEEDPTRIGDRNMFMTNSHVGHDCRISNECTFVTGAVLGGHVQVQERATIGGNTGVHQFCRIGRGAMLSGGTGLASDLPPWFMLTGINVVGSINLVGLRRGGFTSEQIATVRWVYQTLYRRSHLLSRAIERLRMRDDDPLVREYIEFIEMSKRGIATARPKPARGGGGPDVSTLEDG